MMRQQLMSTLHAHHSPVLAVLTMPCSTGNEVSMSTALGLLVAGSGGTKAGRIFEMRQQLTITLHVHTTWLIQWPRLTLITFATQLSRHSTAD